MRLEEIKDRTKQAADHLVAALNAGESEVLTQYLAAMARFHTYSFGNVMLIAHQKPDATHVAGLRTWNQLGRFVKKGEKGIFILAPMVGYTRERKPEAAETATEDGKVTAQLLGFRGVYVFDISQTDGQEVPENIVAMVVVLQRKFLLKDSGRKLAHFDKQLHAGQHALSGEIREIDTEEE